jgi:hypothetical protein
MGTDHGATHRWPDAHVGNHNTIGSTRKTLSDAQLRAKFRNCAANAAYPLAAEAVEQAMEFVFHLDAASEATALVHLLTPRE